MLYWILKSSTTRLFNMGVLPGYNRSISSSMEPRRITRFGYRYQFKTPFRGAIDWSLINQYQLTIIKQINSYRLIDFYFSKSNKEIAQTRLDRTESRAGGFAQMPIKCIFPYIKTLH